MPKFGKTSSENLSTCHTDIQLLFEEVVKTYDCSVTQGHRNKEDQNKAFREKRSKLQWPDGNHNKEPSDAADVYPYPIQLPQDGDSDQVVQQKIGRFYHFAGFVKCKAEEMGIRIRWGGDWDSDGDFTDQTFDDLVHFERLD